MKKTKAKKFHFIVTIFILTVILFAGKSYSQDNNKVPSNLKTLFYSDFNKMKIDNSFLKSVSKIDLESSNLNVIPDNVFDCTNLETLILKNNNITTLPIDIRKLYALKVLNLTNTNIQYIPEEISQLKLLKELYLTYEIWQYRLDELHKITRAKIILE
jgi:Leucine-rich repeat (LRR) protein